MSATLTMTPNRRLALRLDPALYLDLIGYDPVPGGGPATADDWQRRILRSTSRRMLVNCARQSGKSTACAGLAMATALDDAPALILIVSSGLRAAGEMFAKVNAAYVALGKPVPTVADNAVTLSLANGSRVVSLPNQPDSIRSYSGPKLIIADESSRIDDRVFAAISPMLAISNGRLIELSTPRGKQGHFWRMYTSGDPAWERIELKAVDNPRISAEFLAQEKRDMLAWEYRQEYECEFMDTEDQLISGEDIEASFCSGETPFFSNEELYA